MKAIKTSLYAVAALAVLSLATAPAGFGQSEDDYVGSEGCGMCHKEEKEQWDNHKHAHVERGCESCHGPGHEHAAAGPSTLRERQEDDEDLYIIATRSSEMCMPCHQQGNDGKIHIASEHLAAYQQQYTEMELNKKGEFNMNCVDCHDPHVSSTEEGGIVRQCLTCHRGNYGVEIKIRAMQDLACEDCHMPYAAMRAESEVINGYRKGDVKSHIFGISVDPDYAFNDGSGNVSVNSDGYARLTVEQTCYACHKTGKATDIPREDLVKRAADIH